MAKASTRKHQRAGAGTESSGVKSVDEIWDAEQDYETRPRKKRKQSREESTRLPIITAGGELQRSNLPEVESEISEDEAAEDPAEEAVDRAEEVEVPTVSARQQLIEAKEELARIAGLLNEDPEEHAPLFRRLAQLGSSGNATIKKLALATQLAVYKDVIPGYRIRPVSDEEPGVKVSKEVRRLRAFEQGLVAGYQGYVRELAKLAKRGEDGLRGVAISCACALMTAVPHFNFRGNLLEILAERLSTRELDADAIRCLRAIEMLFKEDEGGAASLDAVGVLAKMMRARSYRVDEGVLNTFLHLRLLSEFSSKGSQNHIDRPDERRAKARREFRTKKQRKSHKELKVIEKEMREADATVGHEERERMQAETLKLVFATYFRILKAGLPSLMGAVLEGLAKYAHLINQDFFGDLLEALKDLIRGSAARPSAEEKEEEEDDDDDADDDTRNPTRESLLCVITAFALLQGQTASTNTALNLDLHFFITHLYRTLLPLSLHPDPETSPLFLPDPHSPSTPSNPTINIRTPTALLLASLSATLLPPQATRAVPPLRIASFTHRLLALSLQTPEKTSRAVLALLTRVATLQGRKMAALWRTEERRGDGVWDATGGDIEGGNPFAATVWGGELLRVHFSPAVREGIKSLEGVISAVK
ncbi:MAG: hypothetical protein M1832_000297 [Thelocarpon impressellum]|nr:MAG: hypothetical protein M1832_000297 [Thelocarpon impressellum]